MNQRITMHWWLLALRLVIGVIFIYAGVVKLSNPQAFADSIAAYQLWPMIIINIAALSLPLLEIVCGLMLVTGWKSRKASLIILMLSMVFCFGIGQAMARDLVIDCGCFGTGKTTKNEMWTSLVRDFVIFVGTCFLYLEATQNACKDELISES